MAVCLIFPCLFDILSVVHGARANDRHSLGEVKHKEEVHLVPNPKGRAISTFIPHEQQIFLICKSIFVKTGENIQFELCANILFDLLASLLYSRLAVAMCCVCDTNRPIRHFVRTRMVLFAKHFSQNMYCEGRCFYLFCLSCKVGIGVNV